MTAFLNLMTWVFYGVILLAGIGQYLMTGNYSTLQISFAMVIFIMLRLYYHVIRISDWKTGGLNDLKKQLLVVLFYVALFMITILNNQQQLQMSNFGRYHESLYILMMYVMLPILSCCGILICHIRFSEYRQYRRLQDF